MTAASTSAARSARRIAKRIIIHGTLVLDTPTCLGNGDSDGPTDLALLRDSVSDAALLTGATLAGALRHHLGAHEHGYGREERADDLAVVLFGGRRGDENGTQSLVIVSDAVSDAHPTVELRDGVAINGLTGTASRGAKYDLELLAAGTAFPLMLELLVPEGDDETETRLKQALAAALGGLEETLEALAAIGMGVGKSRGFGRCHVASWEVWTFDLRDSGERLAWLTFGRDGVAGQGGQGARGPKPVSDATIATALGVAEPLQDQRHVLRVRACFRLDGPLLIRAGQDATGRVADVAHLRSRRAGHQETVPTVPGTSMAGVLQHRAHRIVAALGRSDADADSFVKSMFGFVRQKTAQRVAGQTAGEAQASRLIVHESIVAGTPSELVQQRVSIDRFTGGAYPGALFAEGIVVGGEEEILTLDLELRRPRDAEIGLVLLLLKDLWTGDLPVGGESSIGRGRLQGVCAQITLREREQQREVEAAVEDPMQLEEGEVAEAQDVTQSPLPEQEGAARPEPAEELSIESAGQTARQEQAGTEQVVWRERSWTIRQDGTELRIDGPDGLDSFVRALAGLPVRTDAAGTETESEP